MNNVIDFGGRKEIFRCLVGSHNYNLNDESSDKDFKVFVSPTFDDLYCSNQFSKSYIGDTEDLDVHDIRKVSSLWWKANVNFLEVLFSDEKTYFGYGENYNERVKELLSEIFSMKDKIAKMNLPYLYNACIGMHLTKKKQVNKGTEGTQHLVDKYGYDTKQALHSWRILDFLRRFSDTNFNDFKSAIWYKNSDNKRKFLLDMKSGKYTLDEYYEIVKKTFEDVECHWEQIYQSRPVDNETNEKLLDIVKEIVRISL